MNLWWYGWYGIVAWLDEYKCKAINTHPYDNEMDMMYLYDCVNDNHFDWVHKKHVVGDISMLDKYELQSNLMILHVVEVLNPT